MSYDSKIIELNGLEFNIKYEIDNGHGAPWEEYDGCGIIRECRSREEKKPGERVMHSDRGCYLMYDIQATINKAAKEDWGLGDEDKAALERHLGRPPTQKEITAEAVERNFNHLWRYCMGDWCYIGVIATLQEDSNYTDSLWGVESEGDYVDEVAKEMMCGLAEQYRKDQDEGAERQKALEDAAELVRAHLPYVAFPDLNEAYYLLCEAAGVQL